MAIHQGYCIICGGYFEQSTRGRKRKLCYERQCRLNYIHQKKRAQRQFQRDNLSYGRKRPTIIFTGLTYDGEIGSGTPYYMQKKEREDDRDIGGLEEREEQ